MNPGFIINFMMPIIVSRRFNIPLDEAEKIVKNSVKDEFKEWIYD